MGDIRDRGYFELAPDLAVEVLSLQRIVRVKLTARSASTLAPERAGVGDRSRFGTSRSVSSGRTQSRLFRRSASVTLEERAARIFRLHLHSSSLGNPKHASSAAVSEKNCGHGLRLRPGFSWRAWHQQGALVTLPRRRMSSGVRPSLSRDSRSLPASSTAFSMRAFPRDAAGVRRSIRVCRAGWGWPPAPIATAFQRRVPNGSSDSRQACRRRAQRFTSAP